MTSYFEKTTDAWFNDSYRGIETSFMGEFTFDQGLEVFVKRCPSKTRPIEHSVGVKIYKYGLLRGGLSESQHYDGWA